jgi:ribosome-binding factor A
MTAKASRTASQRPLRVGEEVRHVLAEIFERGELRDPVLQNMALTVTEVRMSSDLRQASVYVLPLGGGHAPEVLAALGRAKGFLRSRIGARIRLRYVPDLHLRLDATFEEASRINALIDRARLADGERGLPKNDRGQSETSEAKDA